MPFLLGGIAAVAVLAVLIFTLTAVAIYNSPEKKYNRQLSLAERYLGELDYENAIAAYKAAIEIDPDNPEAYKMLAELYLAMDDRDSAMETVRAGIDASGDEVLSAMLTEISAGMNATDETNGNATEDPQLSSGNVTIKVVAANETGAISGAEVKITGEAGEFTGESDSDGKVIFDGLDYGEYTVKCDADGFHKREMTVNVSGSDVAPVVALVPDVAGDDAYVLLTWNGDHDLDLCAFNTEMKEYVNIGHPIDSEGNVFLYADHGADQPYEVIYIHNASAEIAKTIYVADAANARNGSSSQMEADGMTIRVYDSTGLIYESTADTSESAPLWCPCYYYAGTVYDQQDYIYDTTGDQYAWISFDEKDAYTAEESAAAASNEKWKQAYLEYLTSDQSYIYYGSTYTYNWKDMDKQSDVSGTFVYIDEDSVPEMVLSDGWRQIVASYHGGDVQVLGEENLYIGDSSFIRSYIKESGKFCFSYRGIGYYEGLYSLSDSGFKLIHNVEVCPTPDGDNDYYFDGESWDGPGKGDDSWNTPFSKEDYDYSKAVEPDYMDMTYNEIIAYLTPAESETPASQSSDNRMNSAASQAYIDAVNSGFVMIEDLDSEQFQYDIDDMDGDGVIDLWIGCYIITGYDDDINMESSIWKYSVYSYKNGAVQKTDTWSFDAFDGGGCSYSPKTKMFYEDGANVGLVATYKLANGKLTKVDSIESSYGCSSDYEPSAERKFCKTQQELITMLEAFK